ncbi:MAG: hypothetical protein RXN90_06000 [Thermoproteus sp.]
MCARLHLDLLPPLAIPVGSVHAIAGFSLWLTRVKRGWICIHGYSA